MTEGENYAGGLELNFFDSADFEVENPLNPGENAAIIARNAMRILMMGWNEDWQDLVSWRVFSAVFIERDPELLRGMRLGFQQGFQHLYTQLVGQELDPMQFNQAQLFIANCMSLLPFSDLNPFESMAIPQWIDGSWRMVDYKVTPIELTPTSGFRKLFINDDDRVFAYGLEPIRDSEAEPHLIFMGTTYPAGQGFNVQVNTDLEAFETPGKILYRQGRDKIAKWLEKQGKKVHVCGTSLGGSLSLLLAIDQGDKLSRVDALNPPGLYEPWHKSRFDHWDELSEKPPVFIQKQGDDHVSKFGIWKKEWDLLHVTPPEFLQNAGGFVDHALNYAGFAETRFVGVDTEADNESRKTRNFWLYTVLRSLAYVGHEFYRYLILPTVRYVANHKLALAVTAALIVGGLFIPGVTPAMLLIVASAPISFYLICKFADALDVIFGWKEVKEAPCHSADLPRNEDLDMYSNEIVESFSYKEIETYYQAKRCTLKGKSFLPKVSDSQLEEGLSKRELLSRSRDPFYAEQSVDITATKAKIHNIKQTISLVNRFSHFQGASEELKAQLQEEHNSYTLGKV
ncbi:hypothetical protein BN59_02475 [Legionella massiliensis]|uniref:Uncharacterized protein n=1 Tax=Legionella massiliensis TaxID=1034943 RepID=A0A078KYL6_9GAMM|nr:hypothetical protein [Legionella massiliensis]CDZ78167.1 hypothetical protein BN59_02475 [Legionella massiliensis]CEE13905.1 hypothetical protein BN1094_02475 [Legionella massiliensis]